jgi:hypothetical protein
MLFDRKYQSNKQKEELKKSKLERNADVNSSFFLSNYLIGYIRENSACKPAC